MLRSKIVALVNICTRHPGPILALAVILTLFCGYYSARHFTINTDVNQLISQKLDWRQRELEVNGLFPNRIETILAVVDAPTSELATQATAELVERLSTQKALFTEVREPAGGPFFTKNGLLFLSTDQVATSTQEFGRSQALIQVLVSDQNWRGLIQAL